MENPEFRDRQKVKEGNVSSQHFLYTYLQYVRHLITLSRNIALLDSMKAQVEGCKKLSEGKKIVKAQDIVRMYENIIQTLGEVPILAGLEEDKTLAANTKAKVTFLKAFQSYFITQAFIASHKWGEAMAVFQLSLTYVTEVGNCFHEEKNASSS